MSLIKQLAFTSPVESVLSGTSLFRAQGAGELKYKLLTAYLLIAKK
jgi:hypothetical protein